MSLEEFTSYRNEGRIHLIDKRYEESKLSYLKALEIMLQLTGVA